jgi:putative methyltransferase (TIGR04325 family)
MFWLGRLIEPGTRVFDYGGHRGTNFYAYSRYLKYPEGFKWIVCDLPEIVKAGEELARRENRSEISFTTSSPKLRAYRFFLPLVRFSTSKRRHLAFRWQHSQCVRAIFF